MISQVVLNVISGYEVYNYECYIEILNCIKYDNLGCTECDATYTLFIHNCYLTLIRCTQYDALGCTNC